MDQRVKHNSTFLLLLFFFVLFLSLSVSSTETNASKTNPFTAKAFVVRYWNKQISNNLPNPSFLVSKASPLSAVDSAFYAKLAALHSLSSHISSFCSSANLFCFLENASPNSENHNRNRDSNFALYSNKHFSNYGTTRPGGSNDFKNYSLNLNFASGSFATYSRSSTGHQEGFTSYADDANVAASNFTSYSAAATGGSGEFKNYMPRVNVPDLRFTSYDSDGNNHTLAFATYAGDTNSGNEAFTSYAKNGNGVPAEFTSYGDTSNIIGSSFTGYAELGNAANDSFKAYSSNANNPTNNFKSYSVGGNAGVDEFTNYRDGANTGTDSFQSYARNSNSDKASFINYGKSFNEGVDTFKEYGKGSTNQLIGFKVYSLNSTFKDYARKGVNFATYTKATSTSSSKDGSSKVSSGSSVNKWVEPGKFFREFMLKEGTVMKMPDIRDKMPMRSFLPRAILSKMPFSTNLLGEIKEIFHVADNSSMERVITNALHECERSPSQGETKRCVGSVEDMIDFAISVLGRNVVARTTENVSGSNENVMIGSVKGINGGKVTKSVSCHQSLYPHLLYYCHSVPKVRVYIADILEVESKIKINQGVAICHVDTSAWSPGHGAFLALGSRPGLIEVCHWIFENDMTWATADY